VFAGLGAFSSLPRPWWFNIWLSAIPIIVRTALSVARTPYKCLYRQHLARGLDLEILAPARPEPNSHHRLKAVGFSAPVA